MTGLEGVAGLCGEAVPGAVLLVGVGLVRGGSIGAGRQRAGVVRRAGPGRRGERGGAEARRVGGDCGLLDRRGRLGLTVVDLGGQQLRGRRRRPPSRPRRTDRACRAAAPSRPAERSSTNVLVSPASTRAATMIGDVVERAELVAARRTGPARSAARATDRPSTTHRRATAWDAAPGGQRREPPRRGLGPEHGRCAQHRDCGRQPGNGVEPV